MKYELRDFGETLSFMESVGKYIALKEYRSYRDRVPISFYQLGDVDGAILSHFCGDRFKIDGEQVFVIAYQNLEKQGVADIDPREPLCIFDVSIDLIVFQPVIRDLIHCQVHSIINERVFHGTTVGLFPVVFRSNNSIKVDDGVLVRVNEIKRSSHRNAHSTLRFHTTFHEKCATRGFICNNIATGSGGGCDNEAGTLSPITLSPSKSNHIKFEENDPGPLPELPPDDAEEVEIITETSIKKSKKSKKRIKAEKH